MKYKDSLVYANPKLSSIVLPQNAADTTLFECFRHGNRVSNFTNGEIASKSNDLWNNHFSATSAESEDNNKLFSVEVRSGQAAKPVFMSQDLETPFAFASFLANSSNQRKVFIPSTLNMSKILKSVLAQKSLDLVCDHSFYQAQLPGPLAAEYKEMCASVQNVVVAGNQSNVSSSIFSAKATVIDPLTF